MSNLVKSCVLAFLFCLLVRVIGDCSLVFLFSVAKIPTSGIKAFQVRRGVLFGWSKSTWRLSTVSFRGKDLIFPIWICFH